MRDAQIVHTLWPDPTTAAMFLLRSLALAMLAAVVVAQM